MSALPIFPGGDPPSIVGTRELNYRVRDGNGWTLSVINTDYDCNRETTVFEERPVGNPIRSMVTRRRIELLFSP